MGAIAEWPIQFVIGQRRGQPEQLPHLCVYHLLNKTSEACVAWIQRLVSFNVIPGKQQMLYLGQCSRNNFRLPLTIQRIMKRALQFVVFHKIKKIR